MLQTKDQGHKRKCPPKKDLQKFFSNDLHKKRSKNFFAADLQNFNHSTNSAVLEPRTGQFSRTWGFEAKDLSFKAKAKDFKMCPLGRPRGLHLFRVGIKQYFQFAQAKAVDKLLLQSAINRLIFFTELGIDVAYTQARRQGGAGGAMPPDFRFRPPDLFLAPHGIFLGGRSCFFWPEKTLKFVIFVRKKPSDFGEDLFFLEITWFWPEKNVKISARNSLRNSAKTFAPPILILPPRSREAGDAPAYTCNHRCAQVC